MNYLLFLGNDTSNVDTTFRVRMEFTKGSDTTKVYAFKYREEYNNYFLVHMFKYSARTEISNIIIRPESYLNTDIVFTHSPDGFRHWIIANSGSPTEDFEMTFSGQSGLTVDSIGNLLIETIIGNIPITKPKAYTMNNSTGTLTLLNWQPSFSINSNVVSFEEVGGCSGTLVLEFGRPNISGVGNNNDWYTYWGGPSKDEAMDIIVDDNGSIYVTGLTESMNFPNTTGGFVTDHQELSDVFICQFDENGTSVVGTYFGGNGYDLPFGIKQNSMGDVYVVGQTQSENLPIESSEGATLQGLRDGFVVRFNSSLDELKFSRYIGAETDNFIDIATDIAIDLDDDVFIVGTTGGGNNSGFPIMQMTGAYN